MLKKIVAVSGTVESFNVSPKGSYEGLLLKNGGQLIQVNFPQEWSARLADLIAPGKHVEIEAEAQDAEPRERHSTYRLISLRSADKKNWPEDGLEEGPIDFAGTVVRLNYALHGEVNGAILDTGDFLHTRPHGAHALNLAPGMKVKGSGAAKPAWAARRVIEAKEVNGIHLEPKPKPKKKDQ